MSTVYLTIRSVDNCQLHNELLSKIMTRDRLWCHHRQCLERGL